jgi:hypothetical protein
MLGVASNRFAGPRLAIADSVLLCASRLRKKWARQAKGSRPAFTNS